MNASERGQKEGLSRSGVALVMTQLFRLLFGGYLIAFDQLYYNDLESAWTVFLIYTTIGVFTALFLVGRRKPGLVGLISLSAILLIMESIYMVVYFLQAIPNPSWHDPATIWWATLLNYLFPLLTLFLAINVHREQGATHG